MKPNILISGSKRADTWLFYEAAIIAAGGVPHASYAPASDTGYDGLLLCGGDDLDPARFGHENCGSKDIDPDRDAAEFTLAEAYLAAGKPILGVCRGHQLINVALGGTLIQDISSDLQLFHTPGADKQETVHPIRAVEGSLLFQLYGPCFQINSYHHQVVDRLGDGLRAVQWSESGVIEGMQHETLPVLCVQFHPERMTGQRLRPDTVDGAPIFSWFIAQCSGTADAE